MWAKHFALSFLPILSLLPTAFLGYISPGMCDGWLFHALFSLTSYCSDVSYEAYKARRRGPSPLEAAHFSEPTRVGMVAVKRAVFQSIASMSVLSFVIFDPCEAHDYTNHYTLIFPGLCLHLPSIQQ
jgi:hypothetical protein